jgi:PAS domain S-box-containing protein
MNEVVWNRGTINHNSTSLPMKQSIFSSWYFIGGILLFTFFLAVCGYFILEFHRDLHSCSQALTESMERDSMINVHASALADMVLLFEKGSMNPTQRYLLRTKLEKHKVQYTGAQAKYLSLLKNSQDTLLNEILSASKIYFSQTDTLVQQMIAVQSSNVEDEEISILRGLSPAYAAYVGILQGASRDVSLRERRFRGEYEYRLSQLLRNYFIWWIVMLCVLIGLSIAVILLLVYRNNTPSSEARRCQVLLECSRTPISLIDSNGILRYVNPAFLLWSGMKLPQLMRKNLFDVLKIPQREERNGNFWVSIKSLLLSGKSWMSEVEFRRPDGQLVVSEMTLFPVRDVNGKLTECIVQYNDLTERNEISRKIYETQQQYRSIVESSLDGIMIIQDGKSVYVNPSAVYLFGYGSPEEMQNLRLADTIAPPNRASLEVIHEGCIAGEEVLRNYEMRGLTKFGKIIDLEANAHIIEWNERWAVQASFRDITKRKMLEREQSLWLWEQETLSNIDRKLVGIMDLEKIFGAILQQTINLTRAHFAGVLLFDEAQNFVQWKAICGNTLQHSLEPFKPQENFFAVLKNERPNIIHDSNAKEFFPLSQVPILGEEKIISTAWMPLIVEGEHKGMILVGYRHAHEFVGREMRLLNSLAEKHSIAMVNAQLYAVLLQREKELEILAGARVQAQEDERKRIAREIHDGLGQMLTAIKFNLEILEDMISAGQEGQDRIRDMKGLLDDVMKEAREISYNLMPSVLDDFGLVPALQLLSEQFSNRTDVKVQFHTSGAIDRLDPQIEIGLYRIAQESLNNVVKHAEATEVNVQFIHYTKGIRLIIEDNGKGITEKPNIVRATGKGGTGLVSMRERAASFGGTLTIDSTPKNGTFITVEIPLTKVVIHE